MGKLSREKGAAFERRIARWLNEEFPWMFAEFVRQTEESQQGNVGDVKDKNGEAALIVQAKHQKSPSVWKAVKEVEEASKAQMRPGGERPLGVACIRRDGGEDIVAMRPHVFWALVCDILVEWHSTREIRGTFEREEEDANW